MKSPTAVDANTLYQNDDLIRTLAREFQTPLYVFDEQAIRNRCAEVKAAVTYSNFQACYACKALTLGAVLQIIRDEGLWADASSINEVHRALRAGFSSQSIHYTGEGATRNTYRDLVTRNILINCTSIDQIRLLGAVGGTECSLRINPGEGHGANDKTNTGGPNSKHGIYFDQLETAKSVAAQFGIRIVGIHSHIGSGGTDLAYWLNISDKTMEIATEFEDLRILNLGGGMPVIYNSETDKAMPLNDWGAALSERMASFSREMGRDIQLQLEPGRYIVAGCGLLVAEAQAVKSTSDTSGIKGKNYVVVDSGLNHNIRPSLYGSYHPIRFVAPNGRDAGARKPYVIAGNLCESGDLFTVDPDGTPTERILEEIRIGDLMVMAGAGAYTHSMKSEYNSMNTPASVLVTRSGDVRLIERRGTLQDILSREIDTPIAY